MDVQYPNVLMYNGRLYPFNPHNIQYSLPKVTQHGGYVVQCSYKISDNVIAPVFLQTPVMTSTFGLTTGEQEGKIRGSVDVTFNDSSGPEVELFKQTMSMWDSLLLQMAKDNKQKWFKSAKITDEILDYLHIPMVRENVRKSDGQRFSDSMKGKIKRRNDQFCCEVFDSNKNPITLDDLARSSKIRMLLVQSGVWFSESMFVSSFDTPQIQLISSGQMNGFSFVDELPTTTEGLVC